jgi:dimethylargininase
MLALTRPVPTSIGNCELTHLERVPIDWERADLQHRRYEQILESLGCRMTRLPALEDSPDSVFVEDTAVVFDECAVISRPGAPSRRGETASVEEVLRTLRPLHCIESPATLDGGDVLRVGRRVFVGLSSRTTAAAVDQLKAFLKPLGYTVHPTGVRRALHLKTAVSELGDGSLLIDPSRIDASAFDGATTIEVDPTEPTGANVLFVNGTVLCPESAPRTTATLAAHGYRVLSVDASELGKAEAGLTCCSLLVNDHTD